MVMVNQTAVVAVALMCGAFTLRLGAMPQGQDERPRFEVASVKPNVSQDLIVAIQTTGTRFTARGVTLALLIRTAYGVQEFQVIGAPPWADSDKFDIVATMPDLSGAPRVASGAPSWQSLMLRGLLEERFGLAAHAEKRERPVYVIVVARKDGQLGPVSRSIQRRRLRGVSRLARSRRRTVTASSRAARAMQQQRVARSDHDA